MVLAEIPARREHHEERQRRNRSAACAARSDDRAAASCLLRARPRGRSWSARRHAGVVRSAAALVQWAVAGSGGRRSASRAPRRSGRQPSQVRARLGGGSARLGLRRLGQRIRSARARSALGEARRSGRWCLAISSSMLNRVAFSMFLAHLVELGFADHLLDAALELARDGARLAHPDADRAHHPRQILGPDDDERHHANQRQARTRRNRTSANSLASALQRDHGTG